MKQLRFSRCLRCGGTYQHPVLSGYGPLYCDDCRIVVRREKARKRQQAYRIRKGGKS